MKPSRKVRGYLNALARQQRLAAQMSDRLLALAPLRRRLEAAKVDVVRRAAKLTGGEMAAVNRLRPGAAVAAPGTPVKVTVTNLTDRPNKIRLGMGP